MKAEITMPQLVAIAEMADDMSAMIGCAEDSADGSNWDVETNKKINLIDRFLKKNGYKRRYK